MEDKALQDVVERLVRIETKIDNYESIRDRAEQAYALAQNNSDDIKEIKANNKWAWGFIITLGITIVSYLLTNLGGF